MKRMLKSSAVAALTIVALAVSALPAAAFDTVFFTATAEVCADTVYDANGFAKPTKAPCPTSKKNGYQSGNNGLYWTGHPGGKNGPFGLRLDWSDKSKWQDRYGNYRLSSGGQPPLPPCLKFNPLADTAPIPCVLKLEGKLAPVYVPPPVGKNIGAACDVSSGYGGEGWLQSANWSKATLWDVGWPAAAGGTWLVKGHYYYKTQKSKIVQNVKPRRGQLIGVVQAQGGPQCLKSSVPIFGHKGGATNFRAMGILVMTDQDKDPGKEPPPKKNSPWHPKN